MGIWNKIKFAAYAFLFGKSDAAVFLPLAVKILVDAKIRIVANAVRAGIGIDFQQDFFTGGNVIYFIFGAAAPGKPIGEISV